MSCVTSIGSVNSNNARYHCFSSGTINIGEAISQSFDAAKIMVESCASWIESCEIESCETSVCNNSLFFEKIVWDNHKIQLKNSISLDIAFNGDFWEGSNEELGIFLAAFNIQKLEEEFQEEFFVMWDVYSKKPDEKLTEKAKEIKYKILDLVMGV